MFFTQLYIQWQQKYVKVHEKMLNEKKKKIPTPF